jgi:D-arabinose 1-dehydrogenase-like Zn-dependent alcohol dehydrogenase
MRSGWGEVNYPQVVGHEIVGTIVKAGKNVKDIKVAAHYHSCSDMVSSLPLS